MRRASIERLRTVHEWQHRSEMDVSLEPGRFRKGRRAGACARYCMHCRGIKSIPTRQEIIAEFKLAEGIKLILE